MSALPSALAAPRFGRWRERAGLVVTAITLAVALAVFARRGWPRPAELRWAPAAASVLMMLVANDVVCGARWSLFRTPRAGVVDSVRRYAEAAMLSTLVPLGGDAWRARGGRAALDGVATDRLVSGVVVALAALVSASALAYRVGPVVLAAAGLVVLCGAWLAVRRRLGLAGLRASQLGAAAALSFLYMALAGVAFGLAFAAAGLAPQPERLLPLTPLVLLAAAVPSIAGLGPGLVLLGGAAIAAGGSPGQAASVAALVVLGQAAVWAAGWLSLLARGAGR
jgi:hypothetical protein